MFGILHGREKERHCGIRNPFSRLWQFIMQTKRSPPLKTGNFIHDRLMRKEEIAVGSFHALTYLMEIVSESWGIDLPPIWQDISWTKGGNLVFWWPEYRRKTWEMRQLKSPWSSNLSNESSSRVMDSDVAWRSHVTVVTVRPGSLAHRQIHSVAKWLKRQ